MTTPGSWTLLIEFNGMCAAEALAGAREMRLHFVEDAMHRPVLAARERDVRASHDCGPLCKILARDNAGPEAATLGVWPISRGAHLRIDGAAPGHVEMNLDKVDGDPHANPDSLRWLPDLHDILGSAACDPAADFAQFHLTEGTVVPGRLDLERLWEITVDGVNRPPRALAVTIIYTLARGNPEPVNIDLHPGTLSVAPPHGAAPGYRVELTISSLPLAQHHHHGSNQAPHFDAYNRLVDTHKHVEIREVAAAGRANARHDHGGLRPMTVEDPIHCFSAAVLP